MTSDAYSRDPRVQIRGLPAERGSVGGDLATRSNALVSSAVAAKMKMWEVQAMKTLLDKVKSVGGELDPGWTCEIVLRRGAAEHIDDPRSPRPRMLYDRYYWTPQADRRRSFTARFRSATEVLIFVGLIPPEQGPNNRRSLNPKQKRRRIQQTDKTRERYRTLTPEGSADHAMGSDGCGEHSQTVERVSRSSSEAASDRLGKQMGLPTAIVKRDEIDQQPAFPDNYSLEPHTPAIPCTQTSSADQWVLADPATSVNGNTLSPPEDPNTERSIEPSQAQIPKDDVLEELENRHKVAKSEIEQFDKELEEVQEDILWWREQTSVIEMQVQEASEVLQKLKEEQEAIRQSGDLLSEKEHDVRLKRQQAGLKSERAAADYERRRHRVLNDWLAAFSRSYKRKLG